MSEKISLVRHPSNFRSSTTSIEEEVFQLFSELRNLFEQYKKEVPKQRRPWPESFRQRILRLWSLGVSSHQISTECNIPAQTLYSWRQRIKKQKLDPGFTEVNIVRSKRRSHFQIQQDKVRHTHQLQLSQLESISMTLPNGIKLEGLNIDQVKVILQGLDQS